jgi:hypothetical protein
MTIPIKPHQTNLYQTSLIAHLYHSSNSTISQIPHDTPLASYFPLTYYGQVGQICNLSAFAGILDMARNSFPVFWPP